MQKSSSFPVMHLNTGFIYGFKGVFKRGFLKVTKSRTNVKELSYRSSTAVSWLVPASRGEVFGNEECNCKKISFKYLNICKAMLLNVEEVRLGENCGRCTKL